MATEQTKPEEKLEKKAPEKKGVTDTDIEAKKAKVAALQREQQAKLLDEEIFALEHGGKSRKHVKTVADAEEKRAKTLKEDGGKLAVYRLVATAYKPERPGAVAQLHAPGTLIRIPIERLPGESMEAIKSTKPEPEVAFEKA